MVTLQPGTLRSNRLSLTPPLTQNTWPSQMHQEKPFTRIQFSQELSIPSAPILILADSNTALDIAKGEAINHRKAKHINIKYHAIRHYIQEEKIVINHIPSSENIADLFTKALGPQKHQQLVDYMGMQNSYEVME